MHADPAITAGELRHRAEERLQQRIPQDHAARSSGDLQRLLHELQVHQIELEMQNEQLRESQAQLEAAATRYADLYDFAPVGYFTLDPQGVITDLNLTAARLLGVERTRLQGKHFEHFVAMSQRATFNTFLQQVFATETRHSCELALASIEQSAPTVHIEASRIENGEECRAVVVDITARVQMEKALAATREAAVRFELEQRFGALADQEIAGLAEIDTSGRFIFVNDHFCALTGYRREALLSLRMQDITHPEDRLKSDERLRRLVADGRGFIIEKRYVRGDGRPVWVANAVSMVRDAAGRPAGFTAVVLDVTERKQAELALRESEQRFRNLFAHLPVAYQSLDSEGRWLAANQKLAELLGFATPDALLGRRLSDYCADETRARWDGYYATCRTTGQLDRELTLNPRDGRPITVLVSARVQHDAQGDFLCTHCILIDISERRAMEAQILALNAELESKVAARTAELARAYDELHHLSRHDVLTGLPNRLAANERLHSEFVGMKRRRHPYAVLLMDIDLFKRVNDTHGHAVGDQVLKRVADTLRATLRESDFVARFGGEEFLALLPATEFAAACRVAEKLRLAVASASAPIAGPLTISLGLALARPEQTDEYAAVREADDWLYEAKRAGRNQWAAAGGR